MRALEDAFARLRARVRPAAHAAVTAALRAADAADAAKAAHAANTAKAAYVSADTVEAVGAARAAYVVYAAAAAAEAAGTVDAAAAADAAADAVEDAAGAGVPAAELAEALRNATDAAVRALQMAERVFSDLSGGWSPARAEVAGAARPPGALTRRLLAVECALLPADDRDRYAEEWLSLLTELPTRRARAHHVLSLLRGAPCQAWTLRRPLKHAPPT